MIFNPSAHTMIPRRNAYRRYAGSSRRREVTLPGGKQLWFGVIKVLLAVALFLCISSAVFSGSVDRLAVEIGNLEVSQGELANTNMLLRNQKTQMFSSEAIGVQAGNQLAIHIPASGQYQNLRSL